MTGVLDRVDGSLADFRPKNGREYVALQISRRFNDTHRLARYLLAARDHPKRVMLEAARQAMLRRDLNRTPAGDLFFEILAGFDEGSAT
jgi:hypothetical protein